MPAGRGGSAIAAEDPKPAGRVEAAGRRGSAGRCRDRATRRRVWPRSSSRAASATVMRRSTISSPKAQALLRDVDLKYVLTGKGKRQTLRGRPVAFALWSEAKQQWTVAQLELPRPPINWKPGRKPLAFRILTPGIEARHVKGTGAERLMFAFSADGEPLKVYGRKFPVFDNKLVKRRQWSAVVADREAHRLSTVHRRHLRSGLRQRRQGFPGRHGQQGARGAASREGAERGVSGEAARRCHSSAGHHDAGGHRADRRPGLRGEAGGRLRRSAEPVRPQGRGGVSLQRLERQGAGADAIHQSPRAMAPTRWWSGAAPARSSTRCSSAAPRTC